MIGEVDGTMVELFLTYWKAGIAVIAVVIFFETLRRLERHWERKRPVSDEEYLTRMARHRRTSEFELFHISSKQWQVPPSAIETDFNHYLTTGHMPHYVRDYVRKARAKENLRRSEK